MEIIEYEPKYKKDFIRFNTDWIVDNFGFLEREDRETFDRMEKELAADCRRHYISTGSMASMK